MRRGGRAADARGEVGRVGEGFGRDFDDRAGGAEELGVARGGVRQVHAVRGGAFALDELEVGDGGGVAEGEGGVEGGVGGVGGDGGDEEFSPFVGSLLASGLLASCGCSDRSGVGEIGRRFRRGCGGGRWRRGAFKDVDWEGIEELVGHDERSLGGVCILLA